MGISIGLVGLGQFGQAFADLFRSHPLVDRIALCDFEPDRIDAITARPGWDKKFNERDRYASLDELLETDIDAVAVITQPWLHAAQCIQAMEAGKHVYSAAPVMRLPNGDEMLDWCEKLILCCSNTGRHYMLGETTYYRPETMFCRRKAREGAFGDFVYSEGEYFHDVDAACSLREVMQKRLDGKAGREWAAYKEHYRNQGDYDGPMHYPTHSVSGPVSVMGCRAIEVKAYGYANRNNDSFFDDYAYSNEIALFQMSNGSVLRICECREIAGAFHESETFRIMGTRGTFAEGQWMENFRTEPGTAKPLERSNPTIEEMRDPLPDEVNLAFQRIKNPDANDPTDFKPEGHGGSHPYLVHEFVDAIANNRTPAINAWEAVRYMAMGIMAHKSALVEGKTLAVPDFGNAPD